MLPARAIPKIKAPSAAPWVPGAFGGFSLLFSHHAEDGLAADDLVDGVHHEEEPPVLPADADGVSRPDVQAAPRGKAAWVKPEQPKTQGVFGEGDLETPKTQGFISQLPTSLQSQPDQS